MFQFPFSVYQTQSEHKNYKISKIKNYNLKYSRSKAGFELETCLFVNFPVFWLVAVFKGAAYIMYQLWVINNNKYISYENITPGVR